MRVNSSEDLTLALPKGRLLKKTTTFLAGIGIDARAVLKENDRRLIFSGSPRFLVIRPSDVGTYVYHGTADVGIVGNDLLREQELGVYEILDLGFGSCRLVLAGTPQWKKKFEQAETLTTEEFANVRIATNYPRVCKKWSQQRGLDVQVLKLNGSVEIAPLTGFADLVMDLVESGETLKQNGLVEIETILKVSARLIVNRAALKTCDQIQPLIQKMQAKVL